MNKKGMIILGLILSLSTLFAQGCSDSNKPEAVNKPETVNKSEAVKQSETVHIKVVAFDGNSDLVDMANRYNESHDDVEIEVEFRSRYEDLENLSENGVDRLKREIATGKGPDIIDFGPFYTPADILGDYVIDLSGYIDNSEIPLIENLIQAFSYEEKVNVIPTDVVLLSLVIFTDNDNLIGGWDIDQLIDYYTSYQKETPDILLEYGQTKSEILDILTMFTLEEFIDWDTGTCDFENDEFRKILEFCNQFPREFQWDVYPSMEECYKNHTAIMKCTMLKDVFDIYEEKVAFGTDNICYMGYPVEDRNGIITETNNHMFAISKNSQHADEAWEYIESFLQEEYQKEVEMCPINKSVFEERLSDAMLVEYDSESGLPIPKGIYNISGNPTEVYSITERDAQQMRDIVYHVDKSTGMDYEILNDILLEEIQSYFCGDKSIDEVCSIIQSRMNIYVNEKK